MPKFLFYLFFEAMIALGGLSFGTKPMRGGRRLKRAAVGEACLVQFIPSLLYSY